MMRKLREMPGWPVYKVKMGTEGDLETLKLLRSITTAPFRSTRIVDGRLRILDACWMNSQS